MAGLDRRFGSSLREDPIDRPGLIIDDQNDTYVILQDGTRVLLDGTGAPGPPGPPGSGTIPAIDARDYGVSGDGSDQLAEMQAALAGADTGSGGHLPIWLPSGRIVISNQFAFGQNVTWIGNGSRPYNQGGTEIYYTGPAGQDATVAGVAGSDWSNSHIRGVRITHAGASPTTGYALRVFNPTNTSSVREILASGAPDGQISIYGAGGSGNPGPNFFELDTFFCIGGKKPLDIEAGAQNMLVQHGGIELGPTTTHGMYIGGGEVGFALVTQSVKVEGAYDVPAFYMSGLSSYTFTGCMNYDALNTAHIQPSFLYDSPSQEEPDVMMLQCASKGRINCFEARGIPIVIAGGVSTTTKFNYIPARNLMIGPTGLSGAPNQSALILHKDAYLEWTGATGNTNGTDTSLKRAAAGVVNLGKLGVTNRVAATEVIGKAVQGKIEVFDASGNSLGFVALYSAIS